jgi:hypothetical protein
VILDRNAILPAPAQLLPAIFAVAIGVAADAPWRRAMTPRADADRHSRA